MWLLLIAVVVPIVMFLNGLELVIAGTAVQQRLGVLEAVRVGILATAANLLPIPGAILVRTQVLKEGGSRYRDAVRSTGAIGVGWLATSFLLAGVFQWDGRPFLALILLSAGVASSALVAVLLRFSAARLTVIGAIFAVEGLFVLITAIRLYAAFMAIQTPISLDQAFVLAIAAALASAIGVFPGGLGLRELIAGALSPLVGLPAATGVVVTAIDRLVGIAVLAIVSLFLLTFLRRVHRDDLLSRNP